MPICLVVQDTFQLAKSEDEVRILGSLRLTTCMYKDCSPSLLKSVGGSGLVEWVWETVNASMRDGMVTPALKQPMVCSLLEKPTLGLGELNNYSPVQRYKQGD